jgi:hypothetical protein
MTVETFELFDDMEPSTIPGWVKDCVEDPACMGLVTLPTLVDELVKAKLFTSKSEARSMLGNRGVSVFCYEGFGPMYRIDGGNYKSVDGIPVASFNDKVAVITNPTTRWLLNSGDVVKIGKRRFIKMV